LQTVAASRWNHIDNEVNNRINLYLGLAHSDCLNNNSVIPCMFC
jgi:hypothetical protein